MDTFRIKRLKDKIENRIEYLELTIPLEKKYKKLKDNSLIKCNFALGDHLLHGDNAQLNTNTDLLISLADKLQKEQNTTFRILEKIEKTLERQEKTINKIEQNLDYIKTQQEDLIRKYHRDNLIDNPSSSKTQKELININQILKEIKEISLS